MLRRFALLAWIGIFAPAPVLAASLYSVTDLGTLGGTSSVGTAINDAGTAVGYSTLAGGQTRAFMWTVGNGMEDLGALGAGDSRAFDINNNDHIVGETTNQAFRWTSPSGMILIDSANNGKANGLNNSDAAIGERNFGPFDRTVKWDAANTVSNPFPAANVRGIAMNDLGEIVIQLTNGVSYNDGTVATLTAVPLTAATDMNNSRDIVGSTGSFASYYDFDSTTLSVLGKLSPSDTFSRALGINSAGNIVGISQGSGAFIVDFDHQLMTSLTSLLDPAYAGWNILVADDINNLGQIVGVGEFNGVSHAVILNPVPEPTTATLFSAAIATLLAVAARRQARRPTRARIAEGRVTVSSRV
jgi:probable HAF family extracellular repeat protein